jgi:hypothetical protein
VLSQVLRSAEARRPPVGLTRWKLRKQLEAQALKERLDPPPLGEDPISEDEDGRESPGPHEVDSDTERRWIPPESLRDSDGSDSDSTSERSSDADLVPKGYRISRYRWDGEPILERIKYVREVRSRPLLEKWRKGEFLKGKPLTEPTFAYQRRVMRFTHFSLENTRKSLRDNDYLWRLHIFLENMKHITPTRQWKRFFYRLTRVNPAWYVLDTNKKDCVQMYLLMHPHLRAFA